MDFRRNTPTPLIVAAVLEEATGLALVIAPRLAGRALLGAEMGEAASAVARVAGIALIALGVACWPGPALLGMAAYGASVTLYLAARGLFGGMVGPILWAAVALHGFLTALLIRELAQTSWPPRR